MQQDTEQTDVIFRVWKDNGDVIALFPDDDNGVGTCQSYEHVGQHGGADYYGVISRTRPAQPEEYQPLLDELTRIGYSLRVLKRRSSEGHPGVHRDRLGEDSREHPPGLHDGHVRRPGLLREVGIP